MGVSGSGKSTVAGEAARMTGAAMLDGDFLHPRANIEKMAAGEPLTDEDRAPWLRAVADAAHAMSRSNPLSLIVCSALKRRYRDRLREGNPGLGFIYLKGGRDLIAARMAARSGHFFKPAMLDSQFEALEEPGEDEPDVLTVDVSRPTDDVVAAVAALIGRHGTAM